jgi:hypothetical protein
MGSDRWATATFEALGNVVQAFESVTARTAFEQPGKVTRLPDALGGDPKQWFLLAAPAKGKAGFFQLLARKAHFLMLPKPIVAIMKTSRVFFAEQPVSKWANGETLEQENPTTAEIHIPGVSDALAKAGSDLGRPGAPDTSDSFTIFNTIYHEMTHAWVWLHEFYDDEIGELYREGVAAYEGSTGVNGTKFKAHDAFSEAAAYYVGERIGRWCTALQDLDRFMRIPPLFPGELQNVVKAYDGSVPPNGSVVVSNDQPPEDIASPTLSKPLRDAIDEKILDWAPLTRPFEQTQLAVLRDAVPSH